MEVKLLETIFVVRFPPEYLKHVNPKLYLPESFNLFLPRYCRSAYYTGEGLCATRYKGLLNKPDFNACLEQAGKKIQMLQCSPSASVWPH